jgi:hypothetical protein
MQILRGELQEGGTVEVDYKNDDFVFAMQAGRQPSEMAGK